MFSPNQFIKYKPIYDPSCNCLGNSSTKSHLFKILSISETSATLIRVGAEYEGESIIPLIVLDQKYQGL